MTNKLFWSIYTSAILTALLVLLPSALLFLLTTIRKYIANNYKTLLYKIHNKEGVNWKHILLNCIEVINILILFALLSVFIYSQM